MKLRALCRRTTLELVRDPLTLGFGLGFPLVLLLLLSAIQANIPFVSQSIAIGDGRKYVCALVVLDPALLQKWADKRAIQGGYAELSQRPEIRDSIERWMERVNAKLERWETVKKFTILDHELTVENAGVTANMKIRRSVVTDTYGDLVEKMYPQED